MQISSDGTAKPSHCSCLSFSRPGNVRQSFRTAGGMSPCPFEHKAPSSSSELSEWPSLASWTLPFNMNLATCIIVHGKPTSRARRTDVYLLRMRRNACTTGDRKPPVVG